MNIKFLKRLIYCCFSLCLTGYSAQSGFVEFKIDSIVPGLRDTRISAADQKNIMVLYPFDAPFDDSKKIKVASGLFPPLTRYLDPQVIELVDATFPGGSKPLKALYFLYVKLADLINKAQVNRQSDAAKHVFELVKHILNQQKNFLIQNKEFALFTAQDLNKEVSTLLPDDIQQILGPTVPGTTRIRGLRNQIDRLLKYFLEGYLHTLPAYFEQLKALEPLQFGEVLQDTALYCAKQLPSHLLQEEGILSLKKALEGEASQGLRNFSHTEDIILYLRSQHNASSSSLGSSPINPSTTSSVSIPPLSPFFFSLNDLCQLCRIKFSPLSPSRTLLPPQMIYISQLPIALRRAPLKVMSTVDNVYNKGRVESGEPAHEHIPFIEQIRIPTVLNEDQVTVPEIKLGQDIRFIFDDCGHSILTKW